MSIEILDKDIGNLVDDYHVDNVVVDIVDRKNIRVSLFYEGHYQGDVWIDLKNEEVIDHWSI